MPTLLDYAPAFLRALWVTAAIGAAGIAGSVVVAVLLGLLRLAPSRALRVAAAIAVECCRGASALVVLFWVFYALPLLPGMPRLDPVVASILVLSLVGGAYGAEIVRAGVAAVDPGQLDACRALGLTRLQALRRIVVPLALSQIVPAYSSLAADIVKWTSIVSFVGVQDVLHVANAARSVTYDTVTVFCVLAVAYWLLCVASGLAFRALERALPLSRALRAVSGSASGGATLRSIDARIAEAPR